MVSKLPSNLQVLCRGEKATLGFTLLFPNLLAPRSVDEQVGMLTGVSSDKLGLNEMSFKVKSITLHFIYLH